VWTTKVTGDRRHGSNGGEATAEAAMVIAMRTPPPPVAIGRPMSEALAAGIVLTSRTMSVT
jgi:hypothetical protein